MRSPLHLLRRRLRGHLAVAAAALLSACAPVDLLNATVPTWGVSVTHDVAYGSAPRQSLDIYRPDKPSGPLPVVVFFYGGSWDSGNKGEYLFAATSLARSGLLVVVPDYRLYPQVQYPVFLEDCAAAVVWTTHHVAAYGGDPGNLFLMGHSAGAYNVAMLTLDPKLLTAAGGSRNELRGTVTLAGPFDFLPLEDPEVKAVFAPANADLTVTQPISYADGHNPPMLLLHGTGDQTVYPRNTTHLHDKILAAGGPVDEKLYPDVGHIGLILSLAPLFRFKAPALADSVAFIHAHLAPALGE